MIILQIDRIDHAELSALDLRAEAHEAIACCEEVECYRVHIAGRAERAEVTLFPQAGRAGIAAGGNADWVDAHSVDEALSRWAAGDIL